MYPLPAVAGDSLTLKCLVWGTDQITRTVFYKDNTVIRDSVSATYNFPNVTESVKGRYNCDATFTYKANAGGPPYQVVSDQQDVFVQGMHIQTTLFECL